jgi:glyoxylase-like metal-dependent hydrolase (beta-lactamase superfamily II)
MSSYPLTASLRSRRDILWGAAVAVAGGLLAAGPKRLLAASATHKLKLGTAEITIVSDGVFSLPRSLVLPDKPEADIVGLFQAHGASMEIVAETNVTVVRDGPVLALIDTGAGPDFMPTLGKFGDRLEEIGIKAEDVTHVVFTHAHADHFWGVIDPLGDGSRWPKAKHVMSRGERDFWLAQGIEDKVPAFQKSMATGIQRRLKELGDLITVADAGSDVAPGLALMATPGHTPGHVSVAVRSGNEELVVLGDALTHAAVSFGAPDWRWGSDIDADQAVRTRKALLDDLANRKAAVIGYHLPWPGLGRVERQGSAYRYVAS